MTRKTRCRYQEHNDAQMCEHTISAEYVNCSSVCQCECLSQYLWRFECTRYIVLVCISVTPSLSIIDIIDGHMCAIIDGHSVPHLPYMSVPAVYPHVHVSLSPAKRQKEFEQRDTSDYFCFCQPILSSTMCRYKNLCILAATLILLVLSASVCVCLCWVLQSFAQFDHFVECSAFIVCLFLQIAEKSQGIQQVIQWDSWLFDIMPTVCLCVSVCNAHRLSLSHNLHTRFLFAVSRCRFQFVEFPHSRCWPTGFEIQAISHSSQGFHIRLEGFAEWFGLLIRCWVSKALSSWLTR